MADNPNDHDQAQNEAQGFYWDAGTSNQRPDGTRGWMGGPSLIDLYRRAIPNGSFFHFQPLVEIQDANPFQAAPANPPPVEVQVNPAPLEVQANPPVVEIQDANPIEAAPANPPPLEVQANPPPLEVQANPPPVEVEQQPPMEVKDAANPSEVGGRSEDSASLVEDTVTGEDIDNNLTDLQLCATISEVGGCSNDSASVVDEAVQSAALAVLGSNEGLQRSNGSVSSSNWLEDPSNFPTLGGQGSNQDYKDKKIASAAKGNDAKLRKKKFSKYDLWSEPADGESVSSQEGIRSFSSPDRGYSGGRGFGRGNISLRSNASVEKTVAEHEKEKEEKRKPLQALKTEERKVDPKEFESVPQILGKKGNEGIFIQLGSKDKKKECVGKKQKAEKSYEFDKRDFSTSGGGSSSNHAQRSLEAPPTEYPSYFPTLGGRGSGGSSSNDSQSTIAAPQAEDPSPSTEDPSPSTEDPSPPTEDPSPPALGGN